MPVIGSPVSCRAASTNNRINLKQYVASLPTPSVLDVLVAPSSPTKSFRASSINLTTTATTILRFAATQASTLTVTNVNTTTDVLTTSAPHNLSTGNIITLGGTTAPTGTVFNTPYFVRVLTATTFELYTSAANALTSTSKIDVTGTGTSVTIAVTGIQLDRYNLEARSGLSYTASLDGSFLFQLPAGHSLSAWTDTALELFRFTLYEV